MKKTILNLFKSILCLVFAVVLVFLGYELFTLNIIPNNLLIPILIVLALIFIIVFVLMFFFCRRTYSIVLTSILCLLLTLGIGFGDFYLYKTGETLNKITEQKDKVKNTVSVIVLKESDIDNLSSIKSKKIGVFSNIDSYGTKQSVKDIKKSLKNKNEKVSLNTIKYDSVQSLINALYAEDVDAIILNETYRASVLEFEKEHDFNTETKVIHKTIYYTNKKNEALIVSDITNNPFTVLISGNDTYNEEIESTRSDVNLLVTVNPTTQTVLMTSIPRDMYVETVCDPSYACQQGMMDKLTHTGIHGVETTKDTIENFLEVPINYVFTVNYSSLINIVDALDGIDVLVEPGKEVVRFAANDTKGVTGGWNHLDGERALGFARERYAYEDGDNQRIKNQQTVLKAILEKAMSPEIVVKYTSLLDAVSGAFETNMAMNQITDLIKFQIQTNASWNFESYSISGFGDIGYCAELGSEASITIPDEYTVQIAKEKINAVLNGQSSNSVEINEVDEDAES